jgi:nicotinate-nucleotide adenylyltransferase
MASTQPRLGILGGSFDPPHIAHLAIASEAFHTLGLERVLFVPAAAPPHKGGGERTSASTRLELTSLAIDDDLRFTASGVEIERGLVYTADTLRALGDRYAGHDLFFIMGSDSLLQLDTWHEPEELLALCSIAVAPRPGDSAEALAAAAARWGAGRVVVLDLPALGLSSSDVRERVAERRPIRYLVPRRVEQYIMESGLYK